MTAASHPFAGMENNDQVKISIALCTYNGARYLREQLDSLLNQTYRNLEIVAVDDCSSDESAAILSEYAQRDSRLQVYVNAVNRGLKNNFSSALQKCTGAYIAPCDQDDIWMPEKLATLLNMIGYHTLIYCDSELVAANGASLGVKASDRVTTLSTNDPAAFVFDNCVSGHAMLFRRELLDQALPIPDEFFHDWWIAACAAARGGIVYYPQALVKYRQHASNITNMARDRVVPHQPKATGYRLLSLRVTERRIDLLSHLPGPHQSLLRRLRQLWANRESEWFSPRLAWLMVRHGSLLYGTRKPVSSWFLLRRASYFLWGLRIKRLANRNAYGLTG